MFLEGKENRGPENQERRSDAKISTRKNKEEAFLGKERVKEETERNNDLESLATNLRSKIDDLKSIKDTLTQ